MAIITIGLGAILSLIGLGAYINNPESWTALIPAFFGLPLLVLGLLARNERWHKHAMHAAAGIALLGFLGTIRGVLNVARMLSGEEIIRPRAAVVQAVMAVLLAVFLALCINSFVQARRNRATS